MENQPPKLNKVYRIITDKILEALEDGNVAWQRPWRMMDRPKNIRGTFYKGVNVFLLNMAMEKHGYDRNLWLTYNQARELGGIIRKDELKNKHIVIFWHSYDEKNEDGDVVDTRFSLRYFEVYNVAQTEGYEFPPEPEAPKIEPIKSAEKIVKGMPNAPRIKHGGDRAYYATIQDFVNMPHLKNFKKADGYYKVLFHELTHSTGHASRLARFTADHNHTFGSTDYSKEELIAEMGAAFLAGEAGIDLEVNNSAGYLASWMKALDDNPTWVVSAASQAQKAVDYILGKPKETEGNAPSIEKKKPTRKKK